MKKKIALVLLCILMCVSLAPAAVPGAAQSRPESVLAAKLTELGLFPADGEIDGTDFRLNRSANRLEALTVLIYALGKGDEAKAYPKTHPFEDVPSWADGLVSYAYDNGLTKGVSDTMFGAKDPVTAQMYLTFVLRALGYSDGDNRVFTWDAPWALAARCRLLPAQMSGDDFLPADMVNINCAALYTNLQGTQTALYEKLISDGAISKDAFEARFPANPFAAYHLFDDQVTQEIENKYPPGLRADDVYYGQSHFIIDTERADGFLTAQVMIVQGRLKLEKFYGISFSASPIMLTVRLDEEAFQAQTEFFSLDSFSPEKAAAIADSLREGGLARVCEMELRALLDSGQIPFPYEKFAATYEEALAHIAARPFVEKERLETDACTVLSGRLGGGLPHHTALLYLVYKPGSSMGEGRIVELPTQSYGMGSLSPDKISLSEDGSALYYSYYFDRPSETLHREAGTYQYTVDLNTGETSLDIIPD